MSNVILELGGNPNRLDKAIEVFKEQPDSIIIISTESSLQLCIDKLKSAGIPDTQYIFDYTAWDTVTNFTETYKLIKSKKPKKLFVVTDKFHMKRSLVIANTVYFFTGINVVPCSYMGGDLKRVESDSLIWGDFARSLIWKLTGYLFYDSTVKNERMPGIEADAKLYKELFV